MNLNYHLYLKIMIPKILIYDAMLMNHSALKMIVYRMVRMMRSEDIHLEIGKQGTIPILYFTCVVLKIQRQFKKHSQVTIDNSENQLGGIQLTHRKLRLGPSSIT